MHQSSDIVVRDFRAAECFAHDLADRARPDDPHGLRCGAMAVHAMYRVAKASYPKLLNRTIGASHVIARLQQELPTGPFATGYVAQLACKLINPYGHGANSDRFKNECLGHFRNEFPLDQCLTHGMSLLICSAKWWIKAQGIRSIDPRMPPHNVWDLDGKLHSYGFVPRECNAIRNIIRWNPSCS